MNLVSLKYDVMTSGVKTTFGKKSHQHIKVKIPKSPKQEQILENFINRVYANSVSEWVFLYAIYFFVSRFAFRKLGVINCENCVQKELQLEVL